MIDQLLHSVQIFFLRRPVYVRPVDRRTPYRNRRYLLFGEVGEGVKGIPSIEDDGLTRHVMIAEKIPDSRSDCMRMHECRLQMTEVLYILSYLRVGTIEFLLSLVVGETRGRSRFTLML